MVGRFPWTPSTIFISRIARDTGKAMSIPSAFFTDGELLERRVTTRKYALSTIRQPGYCQKAGKTLTSGRSRTNVTNARLDTDRTRCTNPT